MADVFIFYAREDKDFVKRLHDELSKSGRDTWVDWEGILLTAEWLQEIYSAVEGSDAFVFVISLDSIASETCKKEIAHADAQNKRLIPLVIREVDETVSQGNLFRRTVFVV